MNKNYKKWFTLIELLIVIVIIGILIVMMLPKFWNAKMMANDLKRKVFVHKIATAIVTEEAKWIDVIPSNWAW